MKKLQIFVSSTYLDLLEERQSVVEAILTAGHIPAGMELFNASDKSQMETIKKWIRDSDIYMLVLGSKYGSIEKNSGLSYTQLEYEYALSLNKPNFAIVTSYATCDQNDLGKRIYKNFKELVYSQIIKEVSNIDSLKYNTVLSINSLAAEYNEDLIGLTRGNVNIELDSTKQNLNDYKEKYNVLLEKYQKLGGKSKTLIGDITYNDIVDMMSEVVVIIPAGKFGLKQENEKTMLALIDVTSNDLAAGVSNRYNASESEVFIFYNIARYVSSIGLADTKKGPGNATWTRITLNANGKRFIAKMKKNAFNYKERGNII